MTATMLTDRRDSRVIKARTTYRQLVKQVAGGDDLTVAATDKLNDALDRLDAGPEDFTSDVEFWRRLDANKHFDTNYDDIMAAHREDECKEVKIIERLKKELRDAQIRQKVALRKGNIVANLRTELDREMLANRRLFGEGTETGEREPLTATVDAIDLMASRASTLLNGRI